jgi:hypothetical protein
MVGFQEINGLPLVCNAIDCTQIHIQKPIGVTNVITSFLINLKPTICNYMLLLTMKNDSKMSLLDCRVQ